MAVVFLGFATPEVGSTETLYNTDLVKQDLLNHFNTKKGERVMDAEYGCIVWDLLFDLKNESNVSAIETDLKRIIATEPRVTLLSLTVNSIEYGYDAIINLQYKELDTIDTLYINFSNYTSVDSDSADES